MEAIYLPNKNSKKEPQSHKLVWLGPEATAILEEIRSQTSLSYVKIAETLIQAAYPYVQFVDCNACPMHVRGEQLEHKSDERKSAPIGVTSTNGDIKDNNI